MGRSPCCDENGLKKGPWTTEEDEKLINYIKRHGHGSWRALPKLAGLNRCGKSCRLRWTNYLRPDIKRGKFSDEEEQIIINLHSVLGNKWSAIATHLPGRTDNEIKNFWNTHLRKKLLQMGIDPVTHRPRTDHLNLLANLPQLLAAATNLANPIINPWDNIVMRSIQTDATQVAKFQLLQNIIQVLSNTTTTTSPDNSIEALNLLGSLSNIHDQQGLGMNYFHQFGEYIGNSSTSMNLGSTSQIISNSNVNEATQNYIQSIFNSQVSDGHNNENYHQFSANVSAANSLPALVSLSPDQCSTVNQVGNKENPTRHHDQMSNPSSTSTTFEANWGELMEDEAGDSYWKEIIDQATSTPWPNS